MPSGYSGKRVYEKLGLKPGVKLLVINAPDNYPALIETDPASFLKSKNEVPGIIHLFVRSYQEFLNEMNKLRKLMHPDIIIWVSWNKKSSGITTDINEDLVRNYALENSLVDIKVCSVNEIWSGLKLVIPLSKRYSFSLPKMQ